MRLVDVKINRNCVIKNIDIEEMTLRLRILELGLVPNTKIYVKNISLLKKTLLVVFAHSCFSLSSKIASKILVDYE